LKGKNAADGANRTRRRIITGAIGFFALAFFVGAIHISNHFGAAYFFTADIYLRRKNNSLCKE
jgi:hypothetical protein